ncbi:MAG TPA: HD domain-containing phosphohydrolase [Candidatus Baltobacteraceae bacterium]
MLAHVEEATISSISGVVAKDDVVSSLLATLDACSPGASEASAQAGEWCERIARAMRLSDTEVLNVALAGVLRDVGTVATPAEILSKPGHLTNVEWDVVRGHAAKGGQILQRIPSLGRLAPAVRGHHERFDGLGYPDGLAGAAIPIAARIIAVADAFLAMTSERPYRRRMSADQAIGALKAGRGSQWDPEVVDSAVPILAMTKGSA